MTSIRAIGLAMLFAAGCSSPGTTRDPLKAPTTADVFGGASCSVVRPQKEPDLMAWDPGSRANLNRLRQSGVVAVRYETHGCNVELELLSGCIGTTAKYEFSPYSANERKVAHDADELFAAMPIGAARLSGKLTGGRGLRTDLMLAGQYALPPDATFRAADLRGPDCTRATHVISAVYVGAFAMAAGESRTIEASASLFGAGAGAKSSADVEVLGDEGDADACKASQKEAKEDNRCAVPLRIALSRLDGVPAAAPPSPPPSPKGTVGYLTVTSTPWAMVDLDGKRIGATPHVRVAVLPGMHKLRFVGADSKTEKTIVVVATAGETTNVTVNLGDHP
jgi:hypothetical protein